MEQKSARWRDFPRTRGIVGSSVGAWRESCLRHTTRVTTQSKRARRTVLNSSDIIRKPFKNRHIDKERGQNQSAEKHSRIVLNFERNLSCCIYQESVHIRDKVWGKRDEMPASYGFKSNNDARVRCKILNLKGVWRSRQKRPQNASVHVKTKSRCFQIFSCRDPSRVMGQNSLTP